MARYSLRRRNVLRGIVEAVKSIHFCFSIIPRDCELPDASPPIGVCRFARQPDTTGPGHKNSFAEHFTMFSAAERSCRAENASLVNRCTLPLADKIAQALPRSCHRLSGHSVG